MSVVLPTLLYRTPGDHQCAGGTYSYAPASTQAQVEQLLDSGWFLTLPEAIAGEHDESRYAVHGEDDTAPTREELEAKAKELDIKFDGRTTDKSLLEKIEHALAEQAGE